MVTKFSNDELDAFVGAMSDALVEGYVARVTGIRISGYGARPGFEGLEGRVRTVLNGRIDSNVSRWTHLNTKTGLRTEGPLAPGHIIDRINEAATNKAPTRFVQALVQTAGHELSPEEQLEVHNKTVASIERVQAVFDEILAPFESEIAAEEAAKLAERVEAHRIQREAREEELRNRPAPRPQPQPYGVSHRGAELLVCDWMRHLGFITAVPTREGTDGGIDVNSDTHVAQVKNYQAKVGVVEVRELFGVAAAAKKQALFFTSRGYTAEAKLFADAVGMPLFVYKAEEGLLFGVNDVAKQIE